MLTENMQIHKDKIDKVISKRIAIVGYLILSVLIFSCKMQPDSKVEKSEQPNIILILADDMGFSDLGCYGGEIHTPNLDGLAKTGIRYAQFYNGARCCPTRASLMTGVYPHQAGMGWMTNADTGTPAYQGDLSKNVATIAEVLKPAGYSTYMTGKWHLSNTRKNSAEIKDTWPMQRGFEHYFGIIGGAGNYFKLPVFSGNTRYPSPDNFYLTNAIADSSAIFIDKHFKTEAKKPMFMYVAFTSPHWPLHALDKDIKKYEHTYDIGWDSLRELRLKRQYEIGLWTSETDLTPRDVKVPSWDLLSAAEKEDFARRMSIYAAQVDAMDQGIGRIVTKLKELGQLDNTLIFFLADNGACAEFVSSGKSKDLTGNLADTFESYRINWANASNTPFREYKHWIHEGGVRTPLIVHWPKGIDSSLNNHFIRDYGHLTDIMATCVDVAGAYYPKQMNEQEIVPMQGTSLQAHFTRKENGRGPIFWEHEANIGMRDGEWKLVAKTEEDQQFDATKLELYNIQKDPTELHNLASEMPEKRDSMYHAWEKWAEYANVFPMDTREYGERSNAYQRNINGEFDLDFGDWSLNNRSGFADFEIDRSSKISGENSAKVVLKKKSDNANDVSMEWMYPNFNASSLTISFQACSEKTSNLMVYVETAGKQKVNRGTQHFKITSTNQEFSFKTLDLKPNLRYRIVFCFGKNLANNSVWIDNISLN